MVMRNRNGGDGALNWGDDLPPKVRSRFGTGIDQPRHEARPAGPPRDPGPSPAVGRFLELSRLALVFLAVGVVNIVVLLLALAFVQGGPAPAFLVPGR
jgi:hypothetical protein